MSRLRPAAACLGLVLALSPLGPGARPPAAQAAPVHDAIPQVTSLDRHVASASGSATVRVHGTGLGGATTVRFGTTPARTLRVVSPSLVEAGVPAHAPGMVDVTVSTPVGTSAPGTASRFRFRAASQVVDAAAHAGPVGRQGKVQAQATQPVPDANLRVCLDDALGLDPSSTPTAAQLAQLTQLACQGRSITSLQGLQAATSLRAIDMSRNAITDLAPLAPLTGLVELWIEDNKVTSLDALAAHPALQVVQAANNTVASLAPLAGDSALVELGLDANQVADLRPTASLARLSTLHLAFNRITDVGALQGLTSLADLDLWGNGVTSLTPLANLTRLRTLDAAQNHLASVAPLARLTGLAELNLEANRISSTAPLKALTSLTSLNLNNNAVSDVSPLGGLVGLHWLFLRNNQITDLAALARITAQAVEAEDQLVALPPGTAGWWPLQVRDRRGATVPTSGASVSAGTLRWPGAGARSASFATADATFSGRITQQVAVAGVEHAGDSSGDGVADVYTITGAALTLWRGSATSLGYPQAVQGSWGSTTALARLHDINGDQVSDLLTRDNTGALWAWPVLGPGSLAPARQMGRNWNGMTMVVPAGHLTGNADQFVVARRGDGKLFRYRVTSAGLTGLTEVGSGWNAMAQVFGGGDVDRDGREDLMAVRSDGTLWLYRATAQGRLLAGRQVGHGWSGFHSAFVPGDLNGDGVGDLVGVREDGRVFAYTNLTGRWGPARQVAQGWQTTRLQG